MRGGRFKVAEAIYDGSDWDLCALPGPAEPIGIWDGDFAFDSCVFEFPASGIAGMAWDERVACAFKLLLPAYVPATANKPATNPVTRIAGIIPRFRAAGIQALVDAAKEAWILGSSVLRDENADTGEGGQFHLTRLTNPRMELFIP